MKRAWKRNYKDYVITHDDAGRLACYYNIGGLVKWCYYGSTIAEIKKEIDNQSVVWVAAKETGDLISACDSVGLALALIDEYELEDFRCGVYTKDFYDVVDGNTRLSLLREWGA